MPCLFLSSPTWSTGQLELKSDCWLSLKKIGLWEREKGQTAHKGFFTVQKFILQSPVPHFMTLRNEFRRLHLWCSFFFLQQYLSLYLRKKTMSDLINVKCTHYAKQETTSVTSDISVTLTVWHSGDFLSFWNHLVGNWHMGLFIWI